MLTQLFKALGLSKNEALVYEALLSEGESSASQIAAISKVHRRNVYDVLNKLQTRGLVYEVQLKRESRYQAVNPNKLSEILQEKQTLLEKTMPKLQEMYNGTPAEQSVFIYRGIEGWKNCMRDVIRLGEDYYCIAGKGGWMDERLMNFFPWFLEELKKKNINCYVLFDHEVHANQHPVVQHVGKNYRFFPEERSSTASVEIFGDRVNLVTDIKFGGLDRDFEFTVIANRQLADAFRNWFRVMWDSCCIY